MAFAAERRDPPAIEVRVNFGVYAGREATPAEIDRLAGWLLDEVGEVSIISEQRHMFDPRAEASVHQVGSRWPPIAHRPTSAERAKMEERIVERAEHWARLCVAERRVEITDGV